jgi:hypothetical protein
MARKMRAENPVDPYQTKEKINRHPKVQQPQSVRQMADKAPKNAQSNRHFS